MVNVIELLKDQAKQLRKNGWPHLALQSEKIYQRLERRQAKKTTKPEVKDAP